MKPIAIIKAGTAAPGIKRTFGDFEDWITRYAGLNGQDVSVIEVFRGRSLPEPSTVSGVIVTGSYSMVTDPDPWIATTADWLPRLIEHEIPLLGICFGHQLLGRALGGRAGYHPKGREIGTVGISLTPEGKTDPLLGSLPPTFSGHAIHSQTVIELPQNAVLLAANAFEPHQAFRIGKCAWGVQFHPEFSRDIMRAHIDEQSGALTAEGFDVEALKARVADTAPATSLLKKFVQFIRRDSA